MRIFYISELRNGDRFKFVKSRGIELFENRFIQSFPAEVPSGRNKGKIGKGYKYVTGGGVETVIYEDRKVVLYE